MGILFLLIPVLFGPAGGAGQGNAAAHPAGHGRQVEFAVDRGSPGAAVGLPELTGGRLRAARRRVERAGGARAGTS